jgi:hypothetical protein
MRQLESPLGDRPWGDKRMGRKLSTGERLAALAGVVAAVAALVGFIPGIYRDTRPLVIQSHGQDVATLVLALPVLALALWAASRGSIRGRLVVLGALGYLLYTYAIFAFDAVLNPATPLYIAVVGLAVWSFALSMPRIAEAEVEATVGDRVRRRASGIFLLVIAVIFALLWLSQIGRAAITGQQPQALRDSGWPTSPIYVLDLALLVPLCVVTGIQLLKRRPGALRFAVPLLVFIPVLALGVLSITAFVALDGQPFGFVEGGLFAVSTVVGGVLAWLALDPRPRVEEVARTDSVPGLGPSTLSRSEVVPDR